MNVREKNAKVGAIVIIMLIALAFGLSSQATEVKPETKPVVKPSVNLSLIEEPVYASDAGITLEGPEERAIKIYSDNLPSKKFWNHMDLGTSKNLEVVKVENDKRVVNQKLADVLLATSIFTDWMKSNNLTLDSFRWLDLRQLDVAEASVQTDNNRVRVLIPVAFEIRYVFASETNGTITVYGFVEVIRKSDGGSYFVKVAAYDDTNTAEVAARMATRLFGSKEIIDGKFAKAFGLSLLGAYFRNPAHLYELMHLAQVKPELMNQIPPIP